MATATMKKKEEVSDGSALELTISRAALIGELSFAQSSVQGTTSTSIPILSNVLMETHEGNLTIKATNLDRSICTTIPATVKNHGTIAIPARKLYDYVRLLPEGNITSKALENSWVQINCGRSRTKMVGMSTVSFPTIPDAGAQAAMKVPVDSMKILISRTSFAVSREVSRYTLNGALFGYSPTQIVMGATDAPLL